MRNPVCATIRWSGRTERSSTCQVRRSTSDVSAIPKALRVIEARRAATWVIEGR